MLLRWLCFSAALCFPPVFGFLAHNIFQTGDPRLFDLFCVDNPEDLAAIALNTSTQQDIIKAAVKKSVAKYLSDRHNETLPPAPENLSLSQLYQMYLGPCSSPDRFILAVNDLVDGAARLDILPGIKYDPRFHFDAETIPEAQAMLVERLGLVVTSIKTEGKFKPARDLLGRSLHSIASFYAHTNWVELGNTAPLPGLGYPGGELPELASPSTPACTASNLTTTGLTSGYLPHQEEGANRCRHGSKEDPAGMGGINKDTGSACWSPHGEHHETAAKMATLAVEEYLDNLRFVIGQENFGHLFDLAYGSALVIAIDQSGSMCDEIEAVKQKVIQIVEVALETGITPSRYVLVPFDDPPVPNPTVTTNPEEYLEAVMRTNCHGGGTEQFWTAVQLGLTNAPAYSDIIIFTDESGDDTTIKESVIGLAESLSTQVSVVYSGGSLIQDHLDLCSATGGLCIQFSKVDADQIVELLSSSMEESKAIIGQYKDLTGQMFLQIQLDTSLVTEPDSWTEVQISGRMGQMVLQNPAQDVTVDLSDDAAMAASGLQMEVTIRLPDLLYFKFKPNSAGKWLLALDSSSTYSVTVLASCTFSFLGSFRYLDLASNHPNLHKLPGRPVKGSVPTVMVTLTGDYLEDIASLDRISFVDQRGLVIESHDFKEVFSGQEELIIETSYPNSEGLTSNSFYVRLEGQDQGGQLFQRMLPTQISPSSTQVEVTASSSLIEVTPGNQTSADFRVCDFGEPTDVVINVVDDKGFLVDFDPETVFLDHDTCANVTAIFAVPSDAQVGLVSTITVTARASLDQTSNSASVSLTVVTGQTDLEPPVCWLKMQDESPCRGTAPNRCASENWLLQAYVQDTNSGLGEVRATSTGEGNLTANFMVGTTDVVEVEYLATCCNADVSLTVLDILGNYVTGCGAEFTMRNCSLHQVLEVGPSWIYFEWSRPCEVEDDKEVDYGVTITNLETNHIDWQVEEKHCSSWLCRSNFTFGTPCTEYRMDLNATYLDADQALRSVQYRMRQAVTDEEVSSRPSNFTSTGQDKTSLSLEWTRPGLHDSCLSHYRVCYHILPTRGVNQDDKCVTSSTTSLVLTDLDPCRRYQLKLSAMTAGGLASKSVLLEAGTLHDNPGIVEHLAVTDTGEKYVSLEWDAPSVNPSCVQGYQPTCFVNTTKPQNAVRVIPQERSTNTFTITGLYACTNYTCEVASVGNDHWESAPVSVQATTEITTFSAPPEFTADFVGSREAIVSWSCPDQGCRCVHQFLLLWTGAADTDHGELRVDGRELEVTITDLLPCTEYTVTIQAIADTDIQGAASLLELNTREVGPGPVSHLSQYAITQTSIDARWQYPTQDPQCVNSFETSISESCELRKQPHPTSSVSAKWNHFNASGLTCDTCYEITVSPVSPSGLQGQAATVDIFTDEC